MFRALAITVALPALLHSSAAGHIVPRDSSPEARVTSHESRGTSRAKVALLPMKPQTTSCPPAISDNDLSMAMLIELTRTSEFQFVESATIQETFEDQLIDDAVFELLVTGDVRQSLDVLDTFSEEAGRTRLYGHAAHRLGIDYLIEATCKTVRDKAEICYRLIDTRTNASVFARTLAGARSGLACETAKRMTRDLWRVRHCE